MVPDPFPRDALDANRAGHLTSSQILGLRLDARASRRSGLTAGSALLATGLFILAGTIAGSVPGPRWESLLIGAAIALVGGALLATRGLTRGPRAEQAASGATVLTVVEGPFRRERVDRESIDHSSRRTSSVGSARYLYYLHVGDRRLSVPQAAYEAAPDDGIVRAYLLPDSDHLVNLERIAHAPPSPIEARAAEVSQERFGGTPVNERPAPASAIHTTAASLRSILIGRWRAKGLPLWLEFRADGTVMGGERGSQEAKRWELLDAGRIRIDGEDQRVELDGEEILLATRGPMIRFHRVWS